MHLAHKQSPSSRIALTYHRPRLIPDVLAQQRFSVCGPRKYLVNVYNRHAGFSYGLCTGSVCRSVGGNKAVLEAPQICICMHQSVRTRRSFPLSHQAAGSSRFPRRPIKRCRMRIYVNSSVRPRDPFSTVLPLRKHTVWLSNRKLHDFMRN